MEVLRHLPLLNMTAVDNRQRIRRRCGEASVKINGGKRRVSPIEPERHGIGQTEPREAGVVSGVGADRAEFATPPNRDSESFLQPGLFRLPVLSHPIRRLGQRVGRYQNVPEFGQQLTKEGVLGTERLQSLVAGNDPRIRGAGDQEHGQVGVREGSAPGTSVRLG